MTAEGGEVPVTINGNFPVKYFEKKSVVTVTPVLVYEAGEAKGTPFVYQGEKVTGNDQAVSYKMGGNIAMKTSFKYVPEMRQSELYLDFAVTKGTKSYSLPRVKVADGVVSTSEMANAAGVEPALGNDRFQRIITDNYVAKILFLIQQANVRNSELNSTDMAAVKEAINETKTAENQRIADINIASTASPGGALYLNERIASNREKNTLDHMKRSLKKDKIQSEVSA